jgi:hypothetical protein
MRAAILALAALLFVPCVGVRAADPPAVKLTVKPLLCVLDRDDTGCNLTFRVQWSAVVAANYCLSVDLVSLPLRCWDAAQNGELREKRMASQDFVYWLGVTDSAERLAAAKVQVLRIGSDDRRRERRTRHVWDVL